MYIYLLIVDYLSMYIYIYILCKGDGDTEKERDDMQNNCLIYDMQ